MTNQIDVLIIWHLMIPHCLWRFQHNMVFHSFVKFISCFLCGICIFERSDRFERFFFGCCSVFLRCDNLLHVFESILLKQITFLCVTHCSGCEDEKENLTQRPLVLFSSHVIDRAEVLIGAKLWLARF